MKKCRFCKSEIENGAKICPNCNKKQGGGCLNIVMIGIILVIVFSIISSCSANNTKPPATDTPAVVAPVVDEKSGIIVDQFEAAVNEYINNVNAEDTGVGALGVEIITQGTTAIVKLSFSDLTAWSYSTDIDKKELINVFGKNMNNLAANNVYSSKDVIGVNTIFYSPSGLQLGEYTIFGNAKINN